jgi:hypothetical protein
VIANFMLKKPGYLFGLTRPSVAGFIVTVTPPRRPISTSTAASAPLRLEAISPGKASVSPLVGI